MPLPKFLLAFDVENPAGVAGKPSCLDACAQIVPVLRRADVPATMFIVADLLQDPVQRAGFQYLFEGDNIAMGSHSGQHRPPRVHLLRPDRFTDCAQWRRNDIIESKAIIEGVFGEECPGYRPPWGFPDGLAEYDILRALREAGYRWASSRLWGPDCTLPAPLIDWYTYDELGFPDLVEFPSHGWHENVLKGFSFCEKKVRARLPWPSPFPAEAIPAGFIENPEQEIAINKVFIDLAIAGGLSYITFVWHPWSLLRFDPKMGMLDGTIAYAQSRGMEFSTFEQEYQTHSAGMPAANQAVFAQV